jgi:hypothetical protein
MHIILSSSGMDQVVLGLSLFMGESTKIPTHLVHLKEIRIADDNKAMFGT